MPKSAPTQYPQTEAGVLEMAVKCKSRLIHEFESDIRYECRKLQRWATHYTLMSDKPLLITDEMCGIYHEDAEADAEIAARLEREGQ